LPLIVLGVKLLQKVPVELSEVNYLVQQDDRPRTLGGLHVCPSPGQFFY